MELLSQILAIVIFVVMFISIISDKWHRFIPALIGGSLTIVIVFLIVMRSPESVLNVLSFGQILQPAFWVPGEGHFESSGINWQTIVFIGGMRVMVEGLGEVGFLAMFIDSITVLLFMATVTIELARLLKFDPVPIIIAEIFASNVGGSATMSGDPPNIIIGTAFGYSFFDFVTNTGVIAWIGMIATLVFFYFAFRKALKASQGKVEAETYPEPGDAIVNPRLFKINTGIFAIVVLLIVTHAETGISVSLIGVIAAILTLIAGFRNAAHLMKRVDWKTLLFFIGLFICVGGLEETGVLEVLAEFIADVSGGNLMIVIPMILWISAFTSAIVDNIPFAATMIPVLRNLASSGLPLPPLAWTLALGSDIGGNATPIGASANVVGTAVAAREGYPISWGRFCKYALPAMVVVVALCWLYLIVRYA